MISAVTERGWKFIGAGEWAELRASLPDISDSTMREALRTAEIDVQAPWSGLEQHTFEQLERSLVSLTAVYVENRDLQRYCRQVVIEAKARARWVAQRQSVESGKREMKTEMVEWMLVWLGDPAIFPAWVNLRKSRGATV